MENKTAEKLAEDYCLALHKERAMSGRIQYRIGQDKKVFIAGYNAASLQCAEMKEENESIRGNLESANYVIRVKQKRIEELEAENKVLKNSDDKARISILEYSLNQLKNNHLDEAMLVIKKALSGKESKTE